MHGLTLVLLLVFLFLSGCCDEEREQAPSAEPSEQQGAADMPGFEDSKTLAGILQAALHQETLHSQLSNGKPLVCVKGSKVPHTGWVKNMHANGTLAGLTHYQEGTLHGPAARWYQSGQRAQQTHYQNGKEHGVETWWYQSGQKWKESHFQDGREHGVETWWYKNGHIRSRTHYRNGQLQGPASSWHENGEKWFEIDYQDGQMVKPQGVQ